MTRSAPDPWTVLRGLTAARIALGRSGPAQPTGAHLAFQLAHAQARDAVHHAADFAAVARDLHGAGLESLQVESAVLDRAQYLQRPDLGRRLGPEGEQRLASVPGGAVDLAIIIADGLSGVAVERYATPVATGVAERLGRERWRLAPVVLVRQGRVAVGDPIGAALRAAIVLVLIGERPGLSSPDSLGAYLTWEPKVGRSDAERNCVSNIRREGLPPEAAVEKLCWLLVEARRRALTGVALKDEMGALPRAADRG